MATSFSLASFATGSDTFFTFASNENGNTLLAFFAATASSNDFTTLPATLSDSLGNVWNLLYTNTGLNNSGSANCIAIYACNRSIAGSSNVLQMPAAMQPGDVLATWSNGYEFVAPFSSVILSSTDYVTGQTVPSVIGPNPVNSNQGEFAAVFDSNLTAEPTVVFTTSNNFEYQQLLLPNSGTDSGNAMIAGISSFTVGTNANVSANITPQNTGATPDVFGLTFLLSGSNANPSRGGDAQTLVFSINKGPEPIVPKEGRSIATVQIDCTQQTVTPFPITYPEYSVSGTGTADAVGAVVLEFDLEHLFQGAGLSEVRTLSAWCRPGFNNENVGHGTDDPPLHTDSFLCAILTNKTTLQTVSLGEAAVFFQQQSDDVAAYLIVPFPGNKNSLKYRFIAPQITLDNPVGKYTLQFYNFDLMGAVTLAQPASINF